MLRPLLALVLSSFSLYVDPFTQALRLSSLNLLVHPFFSIPSPTSPYLYYLANSYSCFSFSPSVSSSEKPFLTSPADVDHCLILCYMEHNPINTLDHSDPSLSQFFLSVLLPHNIVCLSVYFYYLSSLLLECWVSDSKDLALFDAKSLAQSLWNRWLHNFLQDGRIV